MKLKREEKVQKYKNKSILFTIFTKRLAVNPQAQTCYTFNHTKLTLHKMPA